MFSGVASLTLSSGLWLTAMAANPLGTEIARTYGVEIGFGSWLLASSLPTLAAMALLPWILYRVIAPEVTASQAHRWIDFFESVIAEDVPLCESVQRGLETGTFDHGYLHPEREKGVIRFHELVRKSLEAQ